MIKEALLLDIQDAEIIQLDEVVIAQSIKILEQNQVRALDALHVASAKVWKAEQFITSDHRQHSAALDSGLNSFLV
jgi:predicted nucleic acid-binding protein